MEYTITKTDTIIMENDWTERIPIVLKGEGIPPRAKISYYYDKSRNETVITAMYKDIKNIEED